MAAKLAEYWAVTMADMLAKKKVGETALWKEGM